MKRFAVLILGFCTLASAAPKFQEADTWRRELRAAVDASGSAFLKPDQQPVHGRRLSDVAARAQKLFGQPTDALFGSCVKAADYYWSAWQAQVGNLSRPNEASLTGQTRMAFEAGAEYWACRLAIDELEVVRKK